MDKTPLALGEISFEMSIVKVYQKILKPVVTPVFSLMPKTIFFSRVESHSLNVF